MRWTGWKVIAVVSVYISLDSTRGVLTKLSKEGTDYEYNPISVTLVSTLTKLIISIIALYWTDSIPERKDLCDGETHKFALPGIVYLIDDNVKFATLYYLTPGEESLYMNLKVITTAVALRLMIKKPISLLQWSALSSLSLGLISARDSNNLHNLNMGHVLVIVVCVIGSIGDVYNEKLLKDTAATSIHLQNAKLYIFGFLLNGIAWIVYESRKGKRSHFFHGWNGYVFALVFITAAIGLNVSAIFRYLDNLVKVQASAASMIATVILSSLIFDKELSLHFYLAVGVVCNALFVYNYSFNVKMSVVEEIVTTTGDQQTEDDDENLIEEQSSRVNK